ncbi:MAG TPA: DnaA N-terminal domain-containing protein [Armatimonadaceae bacterium]|nr:DnaA N-terminal domain-containing protein [Armatimonadaceae bacterium]
MPTSTKPDRATATFQPYYWEAYNEIVQPRRFNHYLIHRWLPELGPLGLAVVLALRDRCYHNPQTGVLRDECEVDMRELAAALGVSRTTLFAEFGRNEALGQFVRRLEQYQMKGGKPHRTANLFRVCMDDPIHPDDLERYDLLRAEKERDRAETTPSGKRVKPESAYESGIRTHSPEPAAYESGIRTAETTSLKSASRTAETMSPESGIRTAYVNLPSGGSIPSESLTPSAGDPPIDSPQGEDRHGSAVTAEDVAGELRDSLLCAAWSEALKALEAQVNRPTFEAHLKPLRPLALDEETGQVELLCPSQFAREWLDKRHREAIEEALGAALGRAASVRLTCP